MERLKLSGGGHCGLAEGHVDPDHRVAPTDPIRRPAIEHAPCSACSQAEHHCDEQSVMTVSSPCQQHLKHRKNPRCNPITQACSGNRLAVGSGYLI